MSYLSKTSITNSVRNNADFQNVTNSTVDTTASLVFVDLPAMTLTTIASNENKKYLITFTATIGQTVANTGIAIILNVNGSDLTSSQRNYVIANSVLDTVRDKIIAVTWEQTIAPTQIVKIRWSAITGGLAGCSHKALSIVGI